MKAYVFPGQGAQFPGMGKDLFGNSSTIAALFHKANEIVGYNLTEIMFQGTPEELKQTKVTQPAIFTHSVLLAIANGNNFTPDMVAGHSLGEFSALTAAGALSFEDGLSLVLKRALAMQKACEAAASTMAAVLNADDALIAEICQSVDDIVVPANFNSPGQVVISGTIRGIDLAIEKLTAAGVRKVIKLPVGGAFHSPVMEPAREELAAAIENTKFAAPRCPVYQNVDAKPHTNPVEIKQNLILQLTSPVLWTQTVKNMVADGADMFIESGPGTVLQGLVKKIAPEVNTMSIA
ncbi:MAG TPA: ACP S-malonyltransferase [Prolixibacteraceae bacterium]|nr:ACP S-malonyltransferase [Bacteroidales bacterium]HQN94258.1 ACP S-malonyltransferase [Prolixibacteraceae bacterium]